MRKMDEYPSHFKVNLSTDYTAAISYSNVHYIELMIAFKSYLLSIFHSNLKNTFRSVE